MLGMSKVKLGRLKTPNMALINADNGQISGTPGLKTTADSTGVLELQTSGNTALTVGTDRSVTFNGHMTIPVGTTAQRPATAANGSMRINTTTGYLEVFYGTRWANVTYVNNDTITATGGNVIISGDYKYHKFTTSGTFTVSTVFIPTTLEVLLVAGGGSGGPGIYGIITGSGGGAGGVLLSNVNASTGSYSMVVGGAGSNSTGFSLTAIAGGAGGASNQAAGGSGGSGGGGAGNFGPGGAGTPGQGYAGASGGPGGGSGTGGGAGGTGTTSTPGPGRYLEQFTAAGGTPAGWFGGGGASQQTPTVAQGGGGAASTSNNPGGAGGVNTGGGGGGGSTDGSTSGGPGGSGIIIIRYRYQG